MSVIMNGRNKEDDFDVYMIEVDLVFGSVAVQSVWRSGRCWRRSRTWQRHIAHRFADDLTYRFQERITEVRGTVI